MLRPGGWLRPLLVDAEVAVDTLQKPDAAGRIAGSDAATADPVAGEATVTPSVLARLRRAWPGWRDATAVLLLVAATWHLVARDGGRGLRDLAPVLALAVLALVACWPDLQRSTRWVRWLAVGWSLSPILAVATAQVRAGMPRPVMIAALAVPVWFATTRVWRRPWGPPVLGGILAATALRSFYVTALAWFGGGGASSSQWLALSWHNQAGALTGAFGVAAVAVVLLTGGRTRWVAGVLAAGSLAGAWLSGSRGAVATVAVGLVVVAVGAWRRVGWRRTLAGLVLVGLATGLVVTLLLAVGGSGVRAHPLAARDQSAAGNLAARVGHWEAALGMVASEPLTGHGPGSYRWAALERYPADTNLTSSAHNEYLEVLGERGLLGAAPIWLAVVAIGWLSLRALAGRGPDTPGRRAGQLGAVGGAAVLGLHAGMDFDWGYPILLVLLVVAAAVVHAETARPSDQREVAPGAAWLVGGAALVALALALAVAAPMFRQQPEPWRLDPRLSDAVAASLAGDVDAARVQLAAAGRWNPGAWSLAPVAAYVEHTAGTIDDAGLVAATTGPHGAGHHDRLLVAGRLVEVGAHGAASTVLDELQASLDERRAWGVEQGVGSTALLRLRSAAATGGCPAADLAWQEQARWLADHDVDPDLVVAAWHEQGSGCQLTTPHAG
jgi:hypothetical protein